MAVYYCDQGNYGSGGGDNADTGGSGDPWLTLDYAFSQMVDGDFLWIKGARDYDTGVIDPESDNVNCAVVGYGTTIGDQGKATIRCQSSPTGGVNLTSGGNNAAVLWENIDFDGNSETVIAVNNTSSNASYRNCDFHHFGTSGSPASSRIVGGRPTHSNIKMWNCYTTSGLIYLWGDNGNNLFFCDCECSHIASAANTDERHLNGLFAYNIEVTDAALVWANISRATLSNAVFHSIGDGSGGKGDIIEIDRDEYYMGLRNIAVWDAGIVLRNTDGSFSNDYNRISLNNVFTGSVTTNISNSGDTYGSITTLTADPFDSNQQINETAGGGAVLRAATEDLNGITSYPFGRWFAPSAGGSGTPFIKRTPRRIG